MKKNKSMNFFKPFKGFLISVLVLFLIGLVLVCCLGLNLSVDIAGGSRFEVLPENASLLDDKTYQNAFVNNQKEIKQKVEKALDKNGVNLAKVQIEGEGNDQRLVFVFKNKKSVHKDDLPSFNEKLKTQILENVKTVSSDITFEVKGIDKVSPSYDINWLVEIVALCLILIVVLTYLSIRFFPYCAVSTICGILVDAILIISTFAITRVEITKFVGCAILVAAFLETLFSVCIFSKIKEQYLANELANVGHDEIVNTAIKSAVFPICFVLVAFVVLGFVMTFASVAFGLYVVIATVIATISSVFFTPVLFGKIAKWKNFIPKFNKFNK